jgi:hypothetical protein
LGVVVFRGEIVEHLFAFVFMTTGIFVQLDLIEIATLLPPVPIEVLADIIECLFQGIRTDAKVCVREHYPCCIYVTIKLEFDIEPFGNVVHYLTHRFAILRLVGLRSSSE